MYVGYKSIKDIDPDVPKPMEDTACDTSHFQRWPLFLISFERNAENKEDYEKYRVGLATQINDVVVSGKDKDGFYLMNNFMNGWNGVYAYDVDSGHGVDAYENSSSLFIGWWSLLVDEEITEMYVETYNLLKDYDELPDILTDSKTTRERNEKILSVAWYKTILFCAIEMAG